MTWHIIPEADRYHIIPDDDLRAHETSCTCWCAPKQDDDEPRVWSHNSMDRREHTIEQGAVQ